MSAYYTIKNKTVEDGKVIYRIDLNADHEVYQGHFPGQPIMPGVVQLYIIESLMSDHFQENLRLQNARTLKFLAIIDPNKTKTIDVVLQAEKTEEGYKLSAMGQAESTKYFRLIGKMTA